jgi:hypothetical protein
MIVNNELERMWKEAFLSWLKITFQDFPQGTEWNHDEISIKIIGVPAEIQTGDLPSISQKR